jgi:hypothetical protein
MHLSAGLVSALLVAAGCAEGSQLFVPVARNVLMRSPVQKIGVGTVRPLSSMTGTGTRRFSRMAHETAGERDQNDSCAPTNAASGIVGECWHRIDESPRSSKLQNKRRFVSLRNASGRGPGEAQRNIANAQPVFWACTSGPRSCVLAAPSCIQLDARLVESPCGPRENRSFEHEDSD